ncbi:hypothetical protein Tco_0515198 [Tanacetum coccineum]
MGYVVSIKEEMVGQMIGQYMVQTRYDNGSGIVRPTFEEAIAFEMKRNFFKELRENTFNRSEKEDANEHIDKVLEMVDLFHIPNVTKGQLMLCVFPKTLTGSINQWG